jgi:hypothetical protein
MQTKVKIHAYITDNIIVVSVINPFTLDFIQEIFSLNDFEEFKESLNAVEVDNCRTRNLLPQSKKVEFYKSLPL